MISYLKPWFTFLIKWVVPARFKINSALIGASAGSERNGLPCLCKRELLSQGRVPLIRRRRLSVVGKRGPGNALEMKGDCSLCRWNAHKPLWRKSLGQCLYKEMNAFPRLWRECTLKQPTGKQGALLAEGRSLKEAATQKEGSFLAEGKEACKQACKQEASLPARHEAWKEAWSWSRSSCWGKKLKQLEEEAPSWSSSWRGCNWRGTCWSKQLKKLQLKKKLLPKQDSWRG